MLLADQWSQRLMRRHDLLIRRTTGEVSSIMQFSAASRLLCCCSLDSFNYARSSHVVQFGGLLGVIYMIIMTELMASRNTKVSGQSWSFGQTMALVLLGQQLIDCASYLRQECRNRRRGERGNSLP